MTCLYRMIKRKRTINSQVTQSVLMKSKISFYIAVAKAIAVVASVFLIQLVLYEHNPSTGTVFVNWPFFASAVSTDTDTDTGIYNIGNSNEEHRNNKRAKQALRSRARRRQLFRTVLDEHYREVLDLAYGHEHAGHQYNGRDIINNDNHKLKQTKKCIYYNRAITSAQRMSDWTIEICPGQSISKLKLIPIHNTITTQKQQTYRLEQKQQYDNDMDMATDTNIHIHGESYHILESHILGLYIDKSTMTHDEYTQEIYKFWGQQQHHNSNYANESKNDDTSKFINNDLPSSSLPSSYHHYYAHGDYSCISPISRTTIKSAVQIQTMNASSSCCPENISNTTTNGHNYFSNQILITNDAQYTILKVMETHTCRYTVLLCKICENTTIDNDDDDDTQNDDEKIDIDYDLQNNIVDLFTHVPDNSQLQHNNVKQNDYNNNHNNNNTTTSNPSSSSWTRKLHYTIPRSFPPMPQSRIKSNIQLIKSMFTHAYDAYMYNAYPSSELKPLSCQGGTFNLVRLPALTLIDSLDTLLIMGNQTEFARSVERLRLLDLQMKENNNIHSSSSSSSSFLKNHKNNGGCGLFAVNQNVSVFETNIRVLGGLLSAHQMAEVWMKDVVLMDDVFDDDGTSVLIGSVGRSKEMNVVDMDNDDIKKMATHHKKRQGEEAIIQPQNPCFNSFSDMVIERQSLFHEICSTPIDNQINATNNLIQQKEYWSYDGFLLTLAHDIGRRLLPAFKSSTGIPYGTVNLLHGIPHQETRE